MRHAFLRLQGACFALILRLLAGLLMALGSSAWAQSPGQQIYRCGHEYLNDQVQALARSCQLVEGGHITVVPGTRVHQQARLSAPSSAADTADVASAGRNPAKPDPRPGQAAPAALSSGMAKVSRTDAAEQRERDRDARGILQAELQKAEARLAAQQQAFRQGAPDKLEAEVHHPQRDLDRLQGMKEELNRTASDIAGLQREMARLPRP